MNLPCLLFFTSVFEGNQFPKYNAPGGLIFRRAYAYLFGGLIFGGAYTWRGLFSEFYGITEKRSKR